MVLLPASRFSLRWSSCQAKARHKAWITECITLPFTKMAFPLRCQLVRDHSPLARSRGELHTVLPASRGTKFSPTFKSYRVRKQPSMHRKRGSSTKMSRGPCPFQREPSCLSFSAQAPLFLRAIGASSPGPLMMATLVGQYQIQPIHLIGRLLSLPSRATASALARKVGATGAVAKWLTSHGVMILAFTPLRLFWTASPPPLAAKGRHSFTR